MKFKKKNSRIKMNQGNLKELKDKATNELEDYLHKGNEFLGLLLIATGLSLSKVDNGWIFIGAGFGTLLIFVYFVYKYFPSTIRELRRKKKECLLSQEEEKLLECLEKNYFSIQAFIKKAFVILFAWIYFWSIFIFKLKEFINIYITMK